MKHGKINLTSRVNQCSLSTSSGGIDMNTLAVNSTGISIHGKMIDGMEVWLYRFKKNGVKKSTFERLIVSFGLAKKYSLMHMRIFEVTTVDVQDFINKLQNDGYGYNTIKKAYNLISAFIKFLIGEGIQIHPSYINVTLPLPENTVKARHEVEAYNKFDQAKIIRAVKPTSGLGAIAAVIMLETGIRSGEALALSWDDVNWDRRALSIHKTLVFPASTSKCFIQDSAKSKSSKRIIPLSKRAYSLLEDLFERSMPSSSNDLIFYGNKGQSYSIGYNVMANQIKALCDEVGVKYKGMHIFRHTFATNCYYKGCEIKILSKLLGHASVTITYNTYIHLYGDALEEMRSIVD